MYGTIASLFPNISLQISVAFGRLAKIKNSKQKAEIAEQLGFIADNLVYDLALFISSKIHAVRNLRSLQRYSMRISMFDSFGQTSLYPIPEYID